MDYSDLLPVNTDWKLKIQEFLDEDIPSFDYGGFVVGSEIKSATLYQKSSGFVCGLTFAKEVFKQCNLEVEWFSKDGEFNEIKSNEKKVIAIVKGPVKNILQAERVSLNLISRLSGITTKTSEIIKLSKGLNYKGLIAGTRKTTPGLRIFEKYAMLIGGADMHRFDLSSMIMLKDNHIWSTGSITNAIANAKKVGGFSIKIEIEVQSLEEAIEAIKSGGDIIMLDNFTCEELKNVSKLLKTEYPGNYLLECSGGLTVDNLKDYLCNDIDIYSTSSIHQGTSVIDFSLKINK